MFNKIWQSPFVIDFDIAAYRCAERARLRLYSKFATDLNNIGTLDMVEMCREPFVFVRGTALVATEVSAPVNRKNTLNTQLKTTLLRVSIQIIQNAQREQMYRMYEPTCKGLGTQVLARTDCSAC